MFDLRGCHFNYAGFDSSLYDLVFAHMDTEKTPIIKGTQAVNSIQSKKNHKHYLTSVSYEDEQVIYDAEIFTYDAQPIGESFLTEVERALFGKNTFGKLYPIDSYYIEPKYYINCIFLNPERIETEAGVVGYKFSLVTDSVMAWETEQTQTFTFANTTSGTKTFTVNVDTDIDDYTYPTVKFTMGSTGGNVSLYNNSDDSTRLTSFEGVSALQTFTMDSSINHLSNNMYQRFSDRNFIRLLNGENNFAFTGNVTSIEVTFNNRVYI